MRGEWEMTFVESGREALEIMDGRSFDVIVSDMQMPEMDGARLLTEVMKKYPQTIRIVLSGHSDHNAVMHSVGIIHQFLAKPCSSDKLKYTVARACALRELLDDENLKAMVSRLESLPSLPSLYAELLDVLNSPDVSLKKVAEVISKDVAMTVKILQLVNSAFFGLGRSIANPTHAVTLLGLETIKALVLSVKVFSNFDIENMKNVSLEEIWKHSVQIGTTAKQIAKSEESDEHVVENTFMAGLLHDVGKLVLAANLSEQYDEVISLSRQSEMSLEEAELNTFGATHAELGSYLIGIWGLPDPIVEAIAFHHNPSKCPEKSFLPLTAVHVANALEHDGSSEEEESSTCKLDHEYLEKTRLDKRLSEWLTLWSAMNEREDK